MASTTTIELRPRSVGELLDLTFQLYRRNFLRLIGIALVVMGPLLALTLISSSGSLVQYASTLANTVQGEGGGAGTATLIAGAVSACAGGLVVLAGLFAPWMDGALTYATIERVLGHQPTVREAYIAARPRWVALWIANAIRTVVMWIALIPLAGGLYGSLVAGILGAGALSSTQSGSADSGLLMLGLLAICLPIGLIGGVVAVYVAVCWSMTVPAIVGEGVDAMASLGRSNALVSGFRWRIIGRLLIFEVMRFFVITLPLSALQVFILGGSVAAFGTGDTSPLGIVVLIAATLFGSLANVLVVPLYAVYITVNYFDLRVRKENLDLQLRAAQLGPAPTPELPALAASQTPGQTPSAPVESPRVAPTAAAPEGTPPASISVSPSSFGVTLTPAQRISVIFKRLRTEGQSSDLLNELGLAYQDVGDQSGALDALTRARTLAPDDADIVYNLALLQRDRKDFAAARNAMAEYLQLESDPVERQKVLDNPALRNLLP